MPNELTEQEIAEDSANTRAETGAMAYFDTFMENRLDPRAQLKMAALACVCMGLTESHEERMALHAASDRLLSCLLDPKLKEELWGKRDDANTKQV